MSKNNKENEMTLIETIGIRKGADSFFQTRAPEDNEIFDFAGQCEDCGSFEIFGGYRSCCIYCV